MCAHSIAIWSPSTRTFVTRNPCSCVLLWVGLSYGLDHLDFALLPYYNNMYGGASAQYPLYGGATTGMVAGATGYYPYFQFGQGGGATSTPAAAYAQGQGYGMQYPHMFHYSGVTTTTAGMTGFGSQLYGVATSLALSPTAQAVVVCTFVARLHGGSFSPKPSRCRGELVFVFRI
ncbi:hypothetical protein BHM03_00005728 [Ensete ventricosum]|nr:hypothetical protein BHM03_00005728 [Ensete ventricosum]